MILSAIKTLYFAMERNYSFVSPTYFVRTIVALNFNQANIMVGSSNEIDCVSVAWRPWPKFSSESYQSKCTHQGRKGTSIPIGVISSSFDKHMMRKLNPQKHDRAQLSASHESVIKFSNFPALKPQR